MGIHVDVNTYEFTTREPDSDGWDRGDSREEINYVTARCVPDEYDYRATKTEGTVYVVIARYGDGDTFGRLDGRHEVMDVTDTHEEAQALSDALEGFAPQTDRTDGVSILKSWTLTHEGKEYFIPWLGYFNTFDGIQIYPCELV